MTGGDPSRSAVAIRPALPAEVDRLRRIDKAARTRYRGQPGLAGAVDAPAIAAERFQTGWTFVAEREAQPTGFMLLQAVDGLLYLANISVAPDASGRGIGRALLTAAEDHAHKLGLPAVTLTTFRSPPWNGPWFRRFGYETMPEARIGDGLRSIRSRQAAVVDMATRETLWKRLG